MNLDLGAFDFLEHCTLMSLRWPDRFTYLTPGTLRRSYLGGRVACGVRFQYALSRVCESLCVRVI